MNLRRTIASNVTAAAFALSAAQCAFAQAQTPPDAAVKAPLAAGVVVKNSHTEFNPYFSPIALGGMGALYAAFCLMGWRRGMKGNLPRAFAGAVLIYGMSNHQQINEEREKLPTETLIVVDQSPSQSLGDRTKATADTHAALSKALAALPGVNVRVVNVGGDHQGVAADGTHIFNSIDDALSDVPRNRLGGVFIATDGQVHDKIADNYTLGDNVPVHALISGKASEYDRRVEIEEGPRFGLVSQKQNIKFRVIHEGTMPNAAAKVPVSILLDGKLTTTQMVTPGQTATVSIDITHAGQNIVEIKAESASGEVTEVNNRIVTSVEGIHEKLKVLIISGSPNPNTRMWRSMLKSDPDVDSVHFMVQRLPEQLDDTPREEMSLMPFPMNEVFAENLGKFNLIVLDNYESRNLLSNDYLENIVKYVKGGGALLVASGPEYAGAESIFKTPLAAVLPAEPTGQVTERDFTPRISERGQRHPVMRGLDGANASGESKPTWGSWYRSVDVKTPAGDVVMEGADKKPLLILSHQEKGRVAMLNTDSTWRWERGYASKGPYASLLLQTSHWLMKNPALEEEALRVSQQKRDIVVEQQTMGDKSTPVTIRMPSGKTLTVTPEVSAPGLWQAKVPATEMGFYSVEQGGKYPRTAFVNVGPDNAREYAATISTPDILKPLVTRTGGLVARMTDTAGNLTTPKLQAVTVDKKDTKLAGDDWMGVRMTDASILRSIDKKQVVDNRILALVLLLSMAAAYWRQAEGNPFRRQKPAKPSAPDGPGL